MLSPIYDVFLMLPGGNRYGYVLPEENVRIRRVRPSAEIIHELSSLTETNSNVSRFALALACIMLCSSEFAGLCVASSRHANPMYYLCVDACCLLLCSLHS